MDIDSGRFRDLVKNLFGAEALTFADAAAIVGIGRLAVDADRKEDAEELALYDSVSRLVCELAGISAPTLQDAAGKKRRGDDDRAARMTLHAGELSSKPARELAFIVAYMLTIADLDIAPREDVFLDALQNALGIDDDRVDGLASMVNDAISIS